MKKLKKIAPSLYEGLKTFYFSEGLNFWRRIFDYWRLKIKYGLSAFKRRKPLKLHLGCGCQHLEGFLNIDFFKTVKTDYVLNVDKLPFSADSVEKIECYHLIEHLSIKDIPKILREWYRVLKSGGRLIMEFPDFDKNVQAYLQGDEKRLFNIFGAQKHKGHFHFWGWNFKRIKKELERSGFSGIAQEEAQDYHASEEPCLRVVAFKK